MNRVDNVLILGSKKQHEPIAEFSKECHERGLRPHSRSEYQEEVVSEEGLTSVLRTIGERAVAHGESIRAVVVNVLPDGDPLIAGNVDQETYHGLIMPLKQLMTVHYMLPIPPEADTYSYLTDPRFRDYDNVLMEMTTGTNASKV